MDILKKGIKKEILLNVDPRLMSKLIYASVNTIVRHGYTPRKSVRHFRG